MVAPYVRRNMMDIDFEPFFREYERLAMAAEESFKRIEKEHAECVKCKLHCTDCCHALFDLSLIEAIYLNHRFNEVVGEEKRAQILEKANMSDRKVHKIKRIAYKAFEAGKSEDEILRINATLSVPNTIKITDKHKSFFVNHKAIPNCPFNKGMNQL